MHECENSADLKHILTSIPLLATLQDLKIECFNCQSKAGNFRSYTDHTSPMWQQDAPMVGGIDISPRLMSVL
jgi:hypothetical protein